MMRSSTLRLIRLGQVSCQTKNTTAKSLACSVVESIKQESGKRYVHLPPLHRRFIHGRPKRLLHEMSSSDSSSYYKDAAVFDTVEAELSESDLYDLSDDSFHNNPRTMKIMSAGVHHYNPNTDLGEGAVYYEQDYDEYTLHMTTNQTNTAHDYEAMDESEMLHHDDVLTVHDARHEWDAEYRHEKNHEEEPADLEEY